MTFLVALVLVTCACAYTDEMLHRHGGWDFSDLTLLFLLVFGATLVLLHGDRL